MAKLDQIASEQFARWEERGRGWKVWPYSVQPEPPFRPFPGYRLPAVDSSNDDGRKPGFLASVLDRIHESLNPKSRTIANPEGVELEPELLERTELAEIQVLLPENSNVESDVFADFVSQLAVCREPITFELLGIEDRVSIQFVSHPADSPILKRQIQSYFPDVACLQTENALLEAWASTGVETAVVEFGLEQEFLIPLETERKTDPFHGLIASMNSLARGELALFQVIFQTTEYDWKQSALRTVQDSLGNPVYINRPELVEQCEEKFASPLHAAVVRIATKAADFDRAWEIARELAFSLRLLTRQNGNSLIPLHNEKYPFEAHEEDVLLRQSRRNGMLLNTDELMGFIHFPSSSVRSPNLVRQTERTKAAPECLTTNRGYILGENGHLGKVVQVGLSPDQRVRHMHVLGTPGSGKSTFIFNLIMQDIREGRGLAVLDPHGDLILRILSEIPEERIDDVVLVDPSDLEYSVGFNILAAHSDLEKTLLSSDLVAVFHRLSTSWGDQMGSVLRNAILAFLESNRGGTLADLQKFLIDPTFRAEFLPTVQDPEIVFYWRKGFTHLSGNKSIGPLLTRLSEFLTPKPIRYMVSQKENRLDFASIMNTGRIFLAKLSQGTMGSENSSLMGSFFMAKFHLAAMSRQSLPESARRDFFIYLDEAHEFATPSMAELLTSARKYRVGMVVAHQDLVQLDHVKEIASAVLGCATRVVFRVGDSNDARKLIEGFRYFDAKDLQNLEKGQAICRVEKADWDFNLEVPLPIEPNPDEAEATRQSVIASSRAKYATARAEIEAVALRTIESTFVPEEPKAAKPASQPLPKDAEKKDSEVQKAMGSEAKEIIADTTVKPAPVRLSPSISPALPSATIPSRPLIATDLGKGGAMHQAVQKRIKEAADNLGLRCVIEQPILNGQRSVDVWLEREGHAIIGCEISITTTIDHEIGNVAKCLQAGLPRVGVICVDQARLGRIEAAVSSSLGKEAAAKVSYFLPDEFIDYLKSLPLETPEPPVVVRRGYKVKRKTSNLTPAEHAEKEAAAIRLLGDSMRRK